MNIETLDNSNSVRRRLRFRASEPPDLEFGMPPCELRVPIRRSSYDLDPRYDPRLRQVEFLRMRRAWESDSIWARRGAPGVRDVQTNTVPALAAWLSVYGNQRQIGARQ